MQIKIAVRYHFTQVRMATIPTNQADTQSIIMAFANKIGSDFPHQHTSSQPAKATRETLSRNKQTKIRN